MRLLASVHTSQDLNLKEIGGLISDLAFRTRESIPPSCLSTLSALTPVTPSNTSAQSMMRTFYNTLISKHTNHWNTHLESPSIQLRFLDIVQLEKESHVWSRIMHSLPAGQMSFMVRAGIDCLSLPINLCR